MELLREFLYLDTRLVDNYLAQVEGGLYDESRTRAEGVSGYEGKAGVKTPVADFGAGAQRSSVTETERVIRETPEARFNRLHTALDATLQDGLAENLWPQATKGMFWELECEVSVPSVARMFGQLDQIDDIASLAEAFGTPLPGFDDQMKVQMNLLSSRVDKRKLVVEGHIADAQPRFAFKLNREFLRVDLDDLEAEVSIVGKIEGKWPEGDSRSIIDLPGINLMSRKDRREIAKKGGSKGVDNLSIPGPGVSMSVVAIYR